MKKDKEAEIDIEVNHTNHYNQMNHSSDENGWKIKRLGEVCGFVRGPFGGSLKKDIFKQSGYAVYEQQHAIYDQFNNIRYFIDENKFNEMKRFELNPGDLIMSCSGTMGKIAIVPENIKKGIINQALLKLSPSKKVLNIFLKLWMESQSFQDSLKEYSGGAAIQNVASVAVLKNIEIPLPPLSEQQRIVAILDEAFAAISKAKANAEQNLKNAKELFESYLQGVFENKGEGWEEKRLGEIIKLEYGKPLDNSLRDFNGLYPLYGANGIKGRTNQFYYNKKTIIVGRKGSAGEINLTEEKFWPLDVTYFVKFDENKYDLLFLFYLLSKKQLTTLAKGVKPGINRNEVYSLTVSVPPLKEQQAIVKKLDALSAETKKLEAIYQKKTEDLEELKKVVLQKVFRGELVESEAVII